ncbi:MAG TPA: HEAT repeat domain-containing protein [Acidimicrobiales bacterium]|nr:HEAT repeat domain-containing protein [Acidimicrobiales bacterium]
MPSDSSAGAAGPAEPGVDRAAARRQEVVVAGHRGDEAGARAALGDPDGSVRAAAVGALARMGALGVADLLAALDDPSPVVRRRAVGEAANAAAGNPATGAPANAATGEAAMSGATGGDAGEAAGEAALGTALRAALEDADPLVAEAACWALGEWRTTAAVAALGAVARDHGDTRCREAAVAALGAVGDRSGLPAVLGALDDKPTVRRRAVVALAAFDGPEVDDALRRSLDDRDWQVREAAAILLDP